MSFEVLNTMGNMLTSAANLFTGGGKNMSVDKSPAAGFMQNPDIPQAGLKDFYNMDPVGGTMRGLSGRSTSARTARIVSPRTSPEAYSKNRPVRIGAPSKVASLQNILGEMYKGLTPNQLTRLRSEGFKSIPVVTAMATKPTSSRTRKNFRDMMQSVNKLA